MSKSDKKKDSNSNLNEKINRSFQHYRQFHVDLIFPVLVIVAVVSLLGPS